MQRSSLKYAWRINFTQTHSTEVHISALQEQEATLLQCGSYFIAHTLQNLNFFVIDKTTYAHNLIRENVVSAQVSGSTKVYEHVVHSALAIMICLHLSLSLIMICLHLSLSLSLIHVLICELETSCITVELWWESQCMGSRWQRPGFCVNESVIHWIKEHHRSSMIAGKVCVDWAK